MSSAHLWVEDGIYSLTWGHQNLHLVLHGEGGGVTSIVLEYDGGPGGGHFHCP